LLLVDAAIANAVRCVPPENKPTTEEIRTCRPFLRQTIDAMPRLRTIVALGKIAHDSVVVTLDRRMSAHRFAHGAVHEIGGLAIFDSYHCSRYNTNTGVLTPGMFRAVFAALRQRLDG
jgi:uracil-DNA glycosylase family 4